MLIPIAPETAKSDLKAKEVAPLPAAPVGGAEGFALELAPPPPPEKEIKLLLAEPDDPELVDDAILPEDVAEADATPPPELALSDTTAAGKATIDPSRSGRRLISAPVAAPEPPTGKGAIPDSPAAPTVPGNLAGVARPLPDAPVTSPTTAPPATQSVNAALTTPTGPELLSQESQPEQTTPKATKQQEAAMQLSRPTRLRNLPITAGRPSAGLPPVVTQSELPVTGANAVRVVEAVQGQSVDPEGNQNATAPKSSQAHSPLPPTQTEATGRAGAQPGVASGPGAQVVASQASTGSPADRPRHQVTHAVLSYDMLPARTAAPPPIPQVLAAYASLTPGQTSAFTGKTPIAETAIVTDPELMLTRTPDTATNSATARPTGPAQAAFTSPEQLAAQLAQIAQNAALHRREIQLNPRELGRVRMNLNAQDTAVHVAILVERPETLDLMRRNIDQLTEEFQALGYQDVSFDFAQHRQEAEPDPASEDSPVLTPATEDDAAQTTSPPPPPQRAAPTGLLDLRI